MSRKAKGTLNHNGLEKVLLWKCHKANESRQAEHERKSLLISSGFSIYSAAPVFAPALAAKAGSRKRNELHI